MTTCSRRSSITEDPIFLEEPLVKTTNLTLDPATTPNQYQAWLFCQADDEVPGRDPAYVPHHLPGKNPYLTEFATMHGLPFAADARRRRDDVPAVHGQDQDDAGPPPPPARR